MTNSLVVFLIGLWILIGSPRSAEAFPELISHGYTSCVSCHISPTGGGIVTPYGRALSDEAISIWGGDEVTPQFLNGSISLPNWLLFGGDIRGAQLHKDDPTIRKGAVIFMQADAEAAVIYDKWVITGSIGAAKGEGEGDGDGDGDGSIIGVSRRHYVKYQASEKFSARIGKFFPAFGIKTPDHVIFTRKAIGWDQGDETYNIEGIFLDQNFEIFVDGIFGKLEKSPSERETGGSARASYNFSESYNIGISYFRGVTQQKQRELAGLFGILGFSERSSLLAEIDFQKTISEENSIDGRVYYSKYSFALFKGFNSTFTAQQSFLDKSDPDLLKNYYGVGFQAFPFAHYEIQFEWQWRQDPLVSRTELSNFAWLQFHYYL